jgi:hypothetical protein
MSPIFSLQLSNNFFDKMPVSIFFPDFDLFGTLCGANQVFPKNKHGRGRKLLYEFTKFVSEKYKV